MPAKYVTSDKCTVEIQVREAAGEVRSLLQGQTDAEFVVLVTSPRTYPRNFTFNADIVDDGSRDLVKFNGAPSHDWAAKLNQVTYHHPKEGKRGIVVETAGSGLANFRVFQLVRDDGVIKKPFSFSLLHDIQIV
jgi:hypothetical protein